MTVTPAPDPKHAIPVHMKYVVASGACGGFVGWVYSETVGTKLPLPIVAAIGACFVLGAAAALISVYVVANSDVTNLPRLIAFALICGIFWKPVLDSSVTYVNQKRDAASSDVRSEAALQSLQNAPAGASAASVTAATEATTDLLKMSDQLKDSKLEEKARMRTEELINVIAETGTADPQASVIALTEVQVAARETGNENLAILAATEIRKFEPRTRFQLQQLQAPAPNPATNFRPRSSTAPSRTGTAAATST